MARSLERLRKQYAAKPGDMRKMGGGPRGGPPGRGMTGKPKNAGQTIRRLMGYVGRYWYKLVLVLLCMLVTTVTSLCGGYLMAPIVDHLALAVNPDTVITMSPIEKIADERGWQLIREVSLGLVSFLKISMYHDLVEKHDRLITNPNIRAICGDPEAVRLPPPVMDRLLSGISIA